MLSANILYVPFKIEFSICLQNQVFDRELGSDDIIPNSIAGVISLNVCLVMTTVLSLNSTDFFASVQLSIFETLCDRNQRHVVGVTHHHGLLHDWKARGILVHDVPQ